MTGESIDHYTTEAHVSILHNIYLINKPRMFNLRIDDLAEKPYIPQKKSLYEFVANVLRDDIGILIFDLH